MGSKQQTKKSLGQDASRLSPALQSAIINAFPDPIFIIDRQGNYAEVIGGKERSLYDSPAYLRGKKLHDILPSKIADRCMRAIDTALKTGSIQIIEYELDAAQCSSNPQDGPQGRQWFQARICPTRVEDDANRYVLFLAINLTEKKQVEIERDRTIEQLQEAFSEIRQLRGIIPICSHCKKIRDDSGYWRQIEAYLQKHSGAEFSHSICPNCIRQYYPGENLDDE
jgi:hypothetical protein